MDSHVPISLNGWNSSPKFRHSSDFSISPQQYAPLRDVLEWPPAQVRNWLVGLGSEFHAISAEFQVQQVRGPDLLQIGLDRLVTLGVTNISHQENVLQAIEQLRNVTGVSGDGTLLTSQSLSVHLSQLIQHLCAGLSPDTAGVDSGPRLSVETFECIHAVLSHLHSLINSLEQLRLPNRPLELHPHSPSLLPWEQTKQSLLSESQTLLCLLSRCDTRERVMGALRACSTISETLTQLFNCFHHPPISNHKSVYLVVPLPSTPGAKLGLNLKKFRDGKIRISEIVPNSPVDQTELLHVGDEVVRVRDQMVVSWELSSVVRLFSENKSSVSLTIRSQAATHSSTPRSIILSTGQSAEASPSDPMRFTYPTHPEEVDDDPLCPKDIMRRRKILRSKTELNDVRPALFKRTMSLPPQDRNIILSNILYQKPLERRLSDSDIFSDKSDKLNSPAFITSPQAYRTLVVGGVITRIPLGSEGEKKRSKKKKGIGKIWKSISFRNIIQPSNPEVKSPSTSSAKDFAESVTESYQIKIINGIPHKFPARGTDKGKQRDKALNKEKKLHSSRLKTSATGFPSSHSVETFNRLGSSLHNGFPDASLGKKTAPSISKSDLLNSGNKGSSPNLQGKFVHRIASNGEVEVELISEISDTIESFNLEHVPPELKVPYTSLQNPECTGWLSKQGGSGLTPKNWRKRWFALKGDNLYYYKSSFDLYALGKIYVPKYALDFHIETKKKFSFSLYHPLTRTYYLYADSEEEIQKWVKFLSDISRPTFSTLGRASSPTSSDSNRYCKSKDSQNSLD